MSEDFDQSQPTVQGPAQADVSPTPAMPAAAVTADDWLDRFLQPARETRGWLKFLGVVSIVIGALTGLTIVGLVIAWLYIWIGVLMLQAGEKAEQAHLQRSPGQLEEYLRKLKTLIVIGGVTTVIYIAAMILFVTLALALGWMALLMNRFWS